MNRRTFSKGLGLLGLLGAISAKPVQAQAPAIKEYSALLTQLNASHPTVIVLKNTLGAAITWTRDGVGYFHGAGGAVVFPGGRTICRKPSVNTEAAQAQETEAYLMPADDETVSLIVQNAAGENVDGMSSLPIEIVVHPAP